MKETDTKQSMIKNILKIKEKYIDAEDANTESIEKGKTIMKKERPDIIFGSFPGPSNAIVSYILSKK